jgi:hypothetical protein
MNLHMAYRACLELIRLIMKRGYAWCREIHGRRVALQAEVVDVADLQQTRIGRAMRRVARGAALGFDGRVLVNERPGGIDVAFGADGVLCRTNAELVRLESAVRVMAVAAAHQAFVYLVMKWLRKGRLYVCVAGIAKLWLRYLEKALLARKLVHAVTTGATYACVAMGGTVEIGMSAYMTTKALVVDQFCGGLAELEDLRYISARFDMSLARSMAVLARDPFTAMHERHARVRIFREFTYKVLMAGFAGFGAGEPGRQRRVIGRRNGGLLTFAASIHPPCFPDARQQQDKRRTK